ncbi:MAG: hypothetical protein GXY80_11630 [Syntrophorhabdus aromaticivorans]|uniref:CRISPR type III-associated protein domain-containing protein n=1 Tax=Syntrophorhabdus aromaticivorans TaxID=328301 RepID=A0A971M6K7_9BACT|nr:hypothetical protein [Syntrophorhabdus aromaticivorans]
MPYMNPFDFIPFHGEPLLKTVDEWIEDGREALLSGRILVRLRALTPLNVTGRIQTRGKAMSFRQFYRQTPPGEMGTQSLPCVPGSSIKGALRSFTEALTNGFISSYNIGSEGIGTDGGGHPDYHKGLYAKKQGHPLRRPPIVGRHIGFLTASYSPDIAGKTFPVPTGKTKTRSFFEFKGVLPKAFALPERLTAETPIDVASVLFGITALPSESKQKEGAGALRGRVVFSDAYFPRDALTTRGHHPKALDLNGKAAFGAPNPSISNWWYFTPRTVGKRIVNGEENAEFIGYRLRGRKFYFHQDPAPCIEYYKKKWTHMPAKLEYYDVESVSAGKDSQPFSIMFRKLPMSLLRLLLFILSPADSVRHKLGALKPFGFGSVEFAVEKVEIEKRGFDRLASRSLSGNDLFSESDDLKVWALPIAGNAGDPKKGNTRDTRVECLAEQGLIDRASWQWLRFVLHYPDELKNQERLFIYPVYRQKRAHEPPLSPEEKGFAQTILMEDLPKKAPAKSWQLAQELYDKKLTIHFDVYQKNASNFDLVRKAAGLPDFDHGVPDPP